MRRLLTCVGGTGSLDRQVNAQKSQRGGSATFYKYKSKYGGMEPSDAKRLRALEDENGKLKKMVTPAVRREAVVYLCKAHNVSHAAASAGDCITPQSSFQHDAICQEGRAWDVLQIDLSTVRYLSRRGADTDRRDAIKRVSRERRRFGCPLPGNRYVVSMRGAHSRDDCARGL